MKTKQTANGWDKHIKMYVENDVLDGMNIYFYRKLVHDITLIKDQIQKEERLKAIKEKIEIYKNVTDDSMINDLYVDEIRALEKQKEELLKS